MAQQNIVIGDTGEAAKNKLNENFNEVYQDLFDAGRAYKIGESTIIDNSGFKGYLCKTDTVAGESPITTPTKWDLVGSENSITVQRNLTFASTLDFSKDLNYYNRGTQSGAIAFTEGVAPTNSNVYVYADFTADGSAITFPAAWKEVVNEYVADSSVYGLIIYWDGVNYQYKLYKIFTPDTITPTLTSASVEASNANEWILLFDEIVTATNLGYTPKINGTPATVTALAGSGTTTLTLTTTETVVSGQTLTLDYSSITGDTEDLAANPLVTLSAFAATNNVGIGTDLNFTTFITNVTKTTPGSDTVYTVFNTGVFGGMASDETFNGDFEFIWLLDGTYGASGSKAQACGIDNDSTPETQGNWILNTIITTTNCACQVGAVTEGNFTIAPLDRLMIKRVGSTVTVWHDSGSGFVLGYTYLGTYTQTGIRFKFWGYGDGSAQTQCYNPKYI